MRRTYSLTCFVQAPPLPAGLSLESSRPGAQGQDILCVETDLWPRVSLSKHFGKDAGIEVVAERGDGYRWSARWTFDGRLLTLQGVKSWTPIRVYVAGSYLRKAEIREVYERLKWAPDLVTCPFDWTDSAALELVREKLKGDEVPPWARPEWTHAQRYQSLLGQREADAVNTADLVFAWLPGRVGTGTEVGIALGSRLSRGWREPSPSVWIAQTSDSDISDQPFYHHPDLEHVAHRLDKPEQVATLIMSWAFALRQSSRRGDQPLTPRRFLESHAEFVAKNGDEDLGEYLRLEVADELAGLASDIRPA